MLLRYSRLCAVAWIAGFGLLPSSHAQAPLSNSANSTEPSDLRVALEAAWANSPQQRAASNRQGELAAKVRASQAWLSAAPSVGVGHRTDRIGSRGGLRDYEAEIQLPLWNPGQRGPAQLLSQAEQDTLAPALASAKLQLAGVLRELAAQTALHHSERAAAERRLTELQTLARDVDRRVAAGDAARIDALQAQASVALAQTVLAQATQQLQQVQTQWRALTGQAEVPALNEPPAALAQHPLHPRLLEWQSKTSAASARLAATEADRRDPLELGLGMVRERSAFGVPPENSLRVNLRIPLGTDGRNAAKLAAARAELDATDAEAALATAQVQAEISAAQRGLRTAQANADLASQRQRLTGEARTLIAKRYALGEADLPTRLRADNEQFDADLAASRALTEVRIATTRLNQAYGLLP